MFGISDYAAFCAAVVLLLALPGPGTLALLTSTAQGGMKAGAAATDGVILGDQILLWLAVAGVAALLSAHPVAFTIVQAAGAAYLVWLGIRLLAVKPGAVPVMRLEPHGYLRQALLITLLNPKAIVFYMAFFPLFVNPVTHRGLSTFVAMAATVAVITAVYCLALCAGAHAVSARFKRHPALAVWAQRAAGLCLVAFGLRLLKSQA